MTSIALPTAGGRPLWRAAQRLGVILTLALLGALWLVPTLALHVLWDMVIPLLPAVFFVNPLIWRNVCPLATLNNLSGNRPGRPSVTPAIARVGRIVGIVLLFVLVPARRFLFNESGSALAITITLVAVLALVAGGFLARRGGFCNSICPVLPVEKLYGQLPLLPMRGVRCDQCTLCSPVGCIDLAQTKAVAQTIGPLRRSAGWLRTGFGAFAAAFPGFVIGYFMAPNGGLATAPAVYLRVLGTAALSYVIVATLTVTLRLRASATVPVLGVVALGLYYWYATPTLARSYGAADAGVLALRVVIGTALGYRLWMMQRPGRSLPVALEG